MKTSVYINLPVKNVARTRAFFANLGYRHNPEFSNETAVCIVISDTIFVMMIEEPVFKGFTSKTVVDATQSTEVIVALTLENKAQVDALLEKAIAQGGTEARPADVHDFMYLRSLHDLDGHIWEFFCFTGAAAEVETDDFAF